MADIGHLNLESATLLGTVDPSRRCYLALQSMSRRGGIDSRPSKISPEELEFAVVPRDDDADLATMLREGQDMVRKGRALIQAAENLGARTEIKPSSEAGDSSTVDFGVLPGRSAEARAQALYLGRRLRDRLFPDGLFAEPAWDLLLAFFLGHREGGVAVEAIFAKCRLRPATGLRFLALLEDLGLVDDRTTASHAPTQVALSGSGLRLMKQFFNLTESAAAVPQAAISGHRTGL